MSYRKLNQVTHPFTFPKPLCDDALQDIDTKSRYFIAVDMDSVYWQVATEKEAHKILESFTPDRKRRCKVIPMGTLNEDPTFIETMMKLQIEWEILSKEHGLKNVASKIIVDDVLLYGRTSKKILSHFRTVLDVLKHHHATLKLKKRKWFQDRCGFLGMDVTSDGTQPKQ